MITSFWSANGSLSWTFRAFTWSAGSTPVSSLSSKSSSLGYLVELDELHITDIVAQAAYWYGMWSHRRDQTWKGYLQVDLDPAADVLATRWLSRYDAGERQP